MHHNTAFKLMSCQLVIAINSLIFVTAHAAGTDAPHNMSNMVECTSCHQMTSTYPKLLPPVIPTPLPDEIDITRSNVACWSCHNEGTAPFVETHSSRTTSARYGAWTVECSVCHNQHIQEQNRYNGSTYGKFIRRYINLANIKGGDGNTLGKAGIKAVVFKGQTGPNSFAHNDALGANGSDSMPDGICQVCHTHTSHWKNDGSLAGIGVHAGYSGTNCTLCHPHKDGFRASCDTCHGYPPIVDIPQPPDGLVKKPAETGSLSAGQHALHATTDDPRYPGDGDGYNYPCTTCHYGGMPVSPIVDDYKLQIGFNIKTEDFLTYPTDKIRDGDGITYDGHSLANGYAYQATNSTTVNSGGSMVCASVYCHTDGKSVIDANTYAPGNYPPNYKGNRSPGWNTANNSGDPQGDGKRCNNCHDNPPRYDAHDFHVVRGYKCDLCHSGIASDSNGDNEFDTIDDPTKHANGRIDLKPAAQFFARGVWNGLYFDYTPAQGGGICSNNTCHQYWRYKDPKAWLNTNIPSAINPTYNWTVTGTSQCGVPNSSGIIRLTIYPNCTDCQTPYTATVNWLGSGNPDDEVVMNNFSGGSLDHIYSYTYDAANPNDYPDRAYNVTWSIKDKEGISMSAPDPRTTRVVVCPQTNIPPEFSWTYQSGPNPNTNDIKIRVTARDPDYATGSHSGDAIIKVDWDGYAADGSGYGISEKKVSLTASDQTIDFDFTYDRSRIYYTIRVSIDDNAPEEGYVTSTKGIGVSSGSVTCHLNCP